MDWRKYWQKNSWWRRLGVLIFNRLQYNLMPDANSFVLECGCGISRGNKYEPNWVGLDTEKMVKPTVLGDVNYLPFRKDAFKLVYSFGLIEHLENPSHAIREMLRVSNYVFFGIPKKNGLIHILHKIYDILGEAWLFPPEKYYEAKELLGTKIKSLLRTIDFYKVERKD